MTAGEIRSDAAIVQLQKRPAGGSDITLKKNVQELGTILDKIVALRPVTWNWKTDKKNEELQYGFIAQEVEAVFPHLVSIQSWKDGTKRKFLSTNDMTPYLVEAIKEQQAQIESLKRTIETLEKE